MSDARFLRVLFDEKGIDAEETFEVEGPSGVNWMPYGVVLDAIRGACKREQEAVVLTLRKIDFQNGDVRHFLRHLAKALAL